MKDDALSRVGKKIKEIRKKKGMNLQDVARKSSVTAGLISKIENFRTIPSLPVLLNISRALEVDLAELVSTVSSNGEMGYFLLRKGEAPVEEREDSLGLHYHELLTHELSDVLFRANLVQIDPEVYRKPIATDAMELIYVINGHVTYGLPEEKEIELHPGDTFFFNGNLAHSVQNQGKEVATLFKVYLLKKN